MRRSLIIIVVLLLSFSCFSQDWITNIEAAKSTAKESDKIIVLVFQGSDWCAPCIKLDKEIWNTNEFKNYAKKHFIMLKADFPRKKKNALSEAQQKHNKKLAEIHNKNGYFPYVVLLDENGKALGSTGYKKTTPNKYIELLESFRK